MCVFLGGGGGISERVEFGPCMGPHFLGAGYIFPVTDIHRAIYIAFNLRTFAYHVFSACS